MVVGPVNVALTHTRYVTFVFSRNRQPHRHTPHLNETRIMTPSRQFHDNRVLALMREGGKGTNNTIGTPLILNVTRNEADVEAPFVRGAFAARGHAHSDVGPCPQGVMREDLEGADVEGEEECQGASEREVEDIVGGNNKEDCIVRWRWHFFLRARHLEPCVHVQACAQSRVGCVLCTEC